MDNLRWVLHYKEGDELYVQVTKALDNKAIPYRSEGGCDELVLVTPAGRFSGVSALELVE